MLPPISITLPNRSERTNEDNDDNNNITYADENENTSQPINSSLTFYPSLSGSSPQPVPASTANDEVPEIGVTSTSAGLPSRKRGRGRPLGSGRQADAGGSGSQRRSAVRARARQTPEDLLNRQLEDLDPNNIYKIPDSSPNQQSPDLPFNNSHLQTAGLLNDGNVCSVLSFILCLHRIGINHHLIDSSFCYTTNNRIDFPSMIIMKILAALPSQNSFSIQVFIESWNQFGKAPRINPGFSEIDALAEGVFSNLQLKQYASRPPVLTEFLGTFHCDKCGKDYSSVKIWEGQLTTSIRLLPLPPDNQPVDVSALLAAHIAQPFETRCSDQGCRQRIFGGKLVVRPGLFTVLAVNRFDVDSGNKRLTKLAFSSRNSQDFLGDLVSVACHRGDVNAGHFVSYHKVDDNWFLNDDSNLCVASENPLDGINVAENETVELLFFINNVE